MTKRELIDEILRLNATARPAFLAEFDTVELGDYLRHLSQASLPRPRVGRETYEKYFAPSAPRATAGRPRAQGGQSTLESIVHHAWQAERDFRFGGELISEEDFSQQPLDAWENDLGDAEVIVPAAMDDAADASSAWPSESESSLFQ